MNLSVLYRGPLTSCNYSCGYCPFAKRMETKSQLQRDQHSLLKFSDWIRTQEQHRWRILFTPWGEALVRSWYRDAVVALTQAPHVDSVAVQTNLSCGLNWMAECRAERLSLWATYHPTETDLDHFVSKVRHVFEAGAGISVGAVGVPEFLEPIRTLRSRLPPEVYLWVNAQQPRKRPYTADEAAHFTAIDPLFAFSARRQPSLGKSCQTGELTFTVDGNGDMRRCHFVEEVIGNIFDPQWESCLRPRHCPNRFCHCFLGKAQLQADELRPFFGPTLLERRPLPQLRS